MKEYYIVERVRDGEDVVKIDGKEYIIRFSAKHAQHISENELDPAHSIKFREIVSLLKDSIVLKTESSKYVSLGRHRKKIYETYFYLIKDRIDIVTSFVSNKPPFIEFYKHYEKEYSK